MLRAINSALTPKIAHSSSGGGEPHNSIVSVVAILGNKKWEIEIYVRDPEEERRLGNDV